MILLLITILKLGIAKESEIINPCKLEDRTLLHFDKVFMNVKGFSFIFKIIDCLTFIFDLINELF